MIGQSRQYSIPSITPRLKSPTPSSRFRTTTTTLPKYSSRHTRFDRILEVGATKKDENGPSRALIEKGVLFGIASILSYSLFFNLPAISTISPPARIDLFDPMKYVGRWYEVASIKRGFAGEGQQDCECTQGIYSPVFDKNGEIKLTVDTFCFHGGPSGRVSGIQGAVSCANPKDLYLLREFKTPLERMEGIVAKCILRFPQLGFIPPEPYDVIRTDYDSFALVQGAADRSFVQIYSRKPRPGKFFIARQKQLLADLGYPLSEIRDTPQTCDVIPIETMMAMKEQIVASNKAEEALKKGGLLFEGPRNFLNSVKDLFNIAKEPSN